MLEARLASLRSLYDTLDGHNDEVEAEYVRIRGILDNLRDGLIFTVRDELHMCRLELGHIRKSTAMELSAFAREMADTTRIVGRALHAAATWEDVPLFSPPRSPSRSEQASTNVEHIPAAMPYPAVVPLEQSKVELEDASFSSLVSSTDSEDNRHHQKGFRKVSAKRLSKVKHTAREWKRQLAVTLSDNAKLKAELRDRDTQFGRYLGELRSAHEEQIRTCQSHIHLLNSALRDVGSAVTTSSNPIDALSVDPKQQMIEGAAVRLLKAIDDTHRLMSHAGLPPPPTNYHLPHHDPSHHHLVDDDIPHGIQRTHSSSSSTAGRRNRGGAHIISPTRTSSSTRAPPADQSRWAKEVLDKHHHRGVAKSHHTAKANRPFL